MEIVQQRNVSEFDDRYHRNRAPFKKLPSENSGKISLSSSDIHSRPSVYDHTISSARKSVVSTSAATRYFKIYTLLPSYCQ
jgi:hypothetical protein